MAVAQLVLEEGLSIDVSSGGEYHVAKVAGFPAEKIFFHGNNKTRAELEYALAGGVGFVVVDSFQELALLEELVAERGERQKVLLRITPGIEAHTHSYIQTGQVDSKFGFGLDDGVAIEAIRRALAAPHLDLVGLHAHIGSQIFELDAFRKAIEILVRPHRRRPTTAFGFECRYLNIGGGLGIRYTEEDTPSSIGEYAAVKVEGVREEMAARRAAHAARAHRAGALHRGQGGRDRVHGGHHQGDPRRAHLRERRRGHERQHPAHALRRAVRGHARQQSRRACRYQSHGGRQALRERRHPHPRRGPGQAGAGRHPGDAGHRARTATPWRRTTTAARGRR